MSRVDELQKKYPRFPRHMIAKEDAGVHGIRDNGDLDEYGQWVRNAGGGGYSSYDHDITLQEWVAVKPGRTKPGLVLRPGRFVLPETGQPIPVTESVNTKSDLEFRDEGSGRFALYQGDERVHDVLLQPRKNKSEKENFAGVPIRWKPNSCFFVNAVRHCEYFSLGVPCKFCNFNMTHEDSRSIGLDTPATVSLEQTLEAYKAHASQFHVVEGKFEMGGFRNNEAEFSLHTNFVEKIAGATAHKPYLKVMNQPMSRKQLQRLKAAGLDAVCHPMEIWDPDLFAECVPGKAQSRGRDGYLEAFQEATDVLGVGSVMSAFVGGLGMMPENGHKTWQEDRDSMIEGLTWMAKHGVLCSVPPLRLPPGAVYTSEENRKKRPPTEYYLELILAQHDLLTQTGYWDKFHRLLSCALCGANSTVQLAAIELAGSLGKWAAAVVPYESNWLLQWEEQYNEKDGGSGTIGKPAKDPLREVA